MKMLRPIRAALRSLGLERHARGLYHRMTRITRPLRFAVLRVIARSPWASTIYYAFVSAAFRREHQAVLAGRVRYYDEQRAGMGAVYLLRRNIHRIEKGLVMRPRRPVFATEYIGETTEKYCELAGRSREAELSGELAWANDVLGVYFDVTGRHPALDAAKRQYTAAGETEGERRLAPYRRDLKAPPPVDYEQLYALSRRRRSVRWFEQKPVPRELIDKAMEVAVQAPSACNRQPYQFRIFDEPERAHRIAAIPMGTAGFSDNIPALAVVVGDLSAYFDERDRHVIYIDASLAAMSFILALETLGLSSCCINWPDIASKEAAMRKELNLRPDERVIMLIAIGYPDPEGMVPYSQKRSLDAARSYNT